MLDGVAACAPPSWSRPSLNFDLCSAKVSLTCVNRERFVHR